MERWARPLEVGVLMAPHLALEVLSAVRQKLSALLQESAGVC